MSPNAKHLVVELQTDRETACQITGTRESLRQLAQDLIAAVDEIPEQASVPYLHLPGWKQQTFESWQDGFFFRVEPDLAAYIKQRPLPKRISSWLQAVFGVLLVALVLIGLRTVWLWISDA
jgi:hypothetical protein